MFKKRPMVLAVLDQKTEQIAQLLFEEVIPLFRVPETHVLDLHGKQSSITSNVGHT